MNELTSSQFELATNLCSLTSLSVCGMWVVTTTGTNTSNFVSTTGMYLPNLNTIFECDDLGQIFIIVSTNLSWFSTSCTSKRCQSKDFFVFVMFTIILVNRS